MITLIISIRKVLSEFLYRFRNNGTISVLDQRGMQRFEHSIYLNGGVAFLAKFFGLTKDMVLVPATLRDSFLEHKGKRVRHN